ncbi:hypothetical protein OZZ08_13710 [Malaciobacter mytili]|uniref:hypothetical protein n=1 Tax=Malaciobacter mytili TaxID=603050 RepID=UPI003BB05769
MHQLKQLINLRKILIIIIGTIIIVTGLNKISIVYPSSHETYNKYIDEGIKLLSTNEYTAIAIGSSIGFSLNFDDLNIKGLNFSYASRDLLEDAYLLKLLVEQSNSIKYIFWSVGGANSMMTNNAWYAPFVRREFYRAVNKYETSLLEPIANDWSNYIQGNFFPLIRKDYWKEPIKKIFKPSKTYEQKDLFKALKIVSKDSLLSRNSNTLTQEYNIQKNNMKQFENSQYYYHNTPQLIMEEVIKMCKFVASKNKQLIFITPPFTKSYLELSNTLNIKGKEYWQKVVKECKENKTIVLDWSKDDNYKNNYKYFYDYIHLNQEGNKIFMKDLYKTLQRL